MDENFVYANLAPAILIFGLITSFLLGAAGVSFPKSKIVRRVVASAAGLLFVGSTTAALVLANL